MKETGSKKIKDPVYGYITIPLVYVTNIVDTAVFQRLRRVIQTSYSPLYASALHNRFAHSLGVFYLGSIVARQLKDAILQGGYLEEKQAESYADTYQIACLLHDIGHAPFSHTGEIYYKNEDFKVTDLHKRLCELVSSTEFEEDLPGESGSAAPHEIMSAIVGLKEFGDMIGNDENKELFARCITGYAYQELSDTNDIKNCFIAMLNSKVIDVDRLDYLLRDAYTSGFSTTGIDYVRLLEALTITLEKGHLEIAYQKDAVSIIENVVYAHDAERKWIQNHSTVVYEAYLLKNIFEELNSKLNTENGKLFSEQSLSREGHTLNGGHRISLLCDDDIIYLAKNVFPTKFSDEFFERNHRRHPVWKSEAEYNAYIRELGRDGDYEINFRECMEAFNESRISEYPLPVVINDALVEQLQKDLDNCKRNGGRGAEAVERKLNFCLYLKNYVDERKLPFDFIIIPTSMFISNFSKNHLAKTLITFGNTHRNKSLNKVCSLLKADAEERDFYYLFYRRGEATENSSGKIEEVADFCKGLFDTVNH